MDEDTAWGVGALFADGDQNLKGGLQDCGDCDDGMRLDGIFAGV
jgi:hypothetical protein